MTEKTNNDQVRGGDALTKFGENEEVSEEESLKGQRDEGGGRAPIPLPLEALIHPQSRDAHIGPISRSSGIYCGPPPNRRDKEK